MTAAVGAALLGGDRSTFMAPLYLAASVSVAIVVWRQRIVVRDDTLYLRLITWHEPLLLDLLTTAEFVWSMPARQLPRTVLRLTDSTGTTLDVALRWWSGWRDLVEIVTATSGIVPQGPTMFPVASRPWTPRT